MFHQAIVNSRGSHILTAILVAALCGIIGMSPLMTSDTSSSVVVEARGAFDRDYFDMEEALPLGEEISHKHRGHHFNGAEKFFEAPKKHHKNFQTGPILTDDLHRSMQTQSCAGILYCGHGTCSPAAGRCICDQDGAKGFWDAGPDGVCSECSAGWATDKCNVECPGGSCNVCNGHGTCSDGVNGDGTCECQGNFAGVECSECSANFFGANCDIPCPGGGSGGVVCNGRGVCKLDASGQGACVCSDGYGAESGCGDCDSAHYGQECQLKCLGFIEATGQPCSGHGFCFNGTAETQNGTCVCDTADGWGTADCSVQCPNRCSGHGRCDAGHLGTAQCICMDNWAPPDCSQCVSTKTGPSCQYDCPVNANTSQICSLQGFCVYDATADWVSKNYTIRNQTTVTLTPIGSSVCDCVSGYTGEVCENGCLGDPPCSGHGTCASNMTSNGTQVVYCQCFSDPVKGYWAGDECDQCQAEYQGSYNCDKPCPKNSVSQVVCSGHGTCAEGICFCARTSADRKEYCGTACEYDAKPGAECETQYFPNYCNTHYMYGAQCTLKCPGFRDLGGQVTACSQHGNCLQGAYQRDGQGDCICDEGYVGESCSLTCLKNPQTNLVCSGIGRGRCVLAPKTVPSDPEVAQCGCYDKFAGPMCELSCPTVAGQICAGHGSCNNTHLGDAKCNCTAGWTGIGCNVPCKCNSQFGRCDADVCANYLPTEECTTCLCTGNFSAPGLCDTCINGTQGEYCEGECVNGITQGRVCQCFTNYSTASCTLKCPEDHLGQVCGGHGVCLFGSSITGRCSCDLDPATQTYPEWFLSNCTKKCTRENCAATFSLDNPQCNPRSGECECLNNDVQHWAGERCSTCVAGYWGKTCASSCRCSGHGSCNKISGGDCACFSSREAGFYSGEQCDVCSEGFIGQNCEQKNIKITRLRTGRDGASGTRYEVQGRTLPSPDVMNMDEEYQILYTGGKPVFQINASGVSGMERLSDTGSSPLYKCANTTAEVAFVTVQPNAFDKSKTSYVFVLLQPVISDECNQTVKLVRVDRLKTFDEGQVVWECSDPWCHPDTPFRVTAAAEKREREVRSKLLSFVIQEQVFDSKTVSFKPGGGGYLYRLDLEDSEAVKVTSIGLSPHFRASDMDITEGDEEKYAIGGSDVPSELNIKWDIHVFEANVTQGVASLIDLYSLNTELKTPCWSTVAGGVDADKCKGCHTASTVYWNDSSIVAGIDSIPDAGDDLGIPYLVWFRPLDPSATYNGQKLVALHDARCKVVTVEKNPNFFRIIDSIGQATDPTQLIIPQMYILKAATNVQDYVISSMAFDSAAGFTYVALADRQYETRRFPSTVAKISNDVNNFAIYGTATDLGFIQAVETVLPEMFSAMALDPIRRILYTLVDKSIDLNLATFLLYDIDTVTPDVVDQREGTFLTIRGSGFQEVPIDPRDPLGEKFPVQCRFGVAGTYKYTPANVSFTELSCIATRADNESATGDTCSGQPVEVSLYGDTWFTANDESIKRVPGARLRSVTPVRGPLVNGPVITISGSGFVASDAAVCIFYSTNPLAEDIPILRSKMTFVTPTLVTCRQPNAQVASYDPSLLDVLLDGQQPSESGPIEYFIVGAAANLTSNAIQVVKAERKTKFNLTVDIVDERAHPRFTLDKEVRRPISIYNGSVSLCDTGEFSSWYSFMQGNYSYPVDSCRPIVVEMEDGFTGTNPLLGGTRDTANGTLTWGDLYLTEPRKGTVLVTFTDVNSYLLSGTRDGWQAFSLVRVIEGDPVALMIENYFDILQLDAQNRGDQAAKGFDKGATVPMFLIVVDELANIIDDPGAALLGTGTGNDQGWFEISTQLFEVDDKDGVQIPVHKLPDFNESISFGEQFVVSHRPGAGVNIPITSIRFNFVHGVAHYANFSAPGLRPVMSPPLRTRLCDGAEFKIPGRPGGGLTGECRACPPVGAKCNGTETIVVLNGYWRADNSSTEIYECDIVEPPICLQAATGHKCAEGHTGPLCSLCEPGYGKSGKTCLPCPDDAEAWGVMAAGGLGFVTGLLIWTVMTLRKAEVTALSVIMRTVVNHMQATGKLGEFSTEWGPLVKSAFAVQSAGSDVSISGLASVECLLRNSGRNYSTIFAAYMCLPLLSVTMAFVVYVVVRVLKMKPVITDELRKEIEEEKKNMPSTRLARLLEYYPFYFVFVTTFCVHMFAMYQTFITQSTLVLKCKELVTRSYYVDGDLQTESSYYLAVDMSIACDENGNHSFYAIALVCAIGYGIGVPIVFMAGYKFVNSRLNKLNLTKLMFLFLIGGYKDEFWFWQAVIMIRKLALVLIIVFVEENKHLQSYLGAWALAVALMLQILFNPNTESEHNLVEACSLAIITVTLNLGLLYLWPGTQGDDNAALRNVLTVFLLIITFGAMAMFAFFMLGPVRTIIMDQLKNIREKLNKALGKEKETEEEKNKRREEALKKTKRREKIRAFANNLDDEDNLYTGPATGKKRAKFSRGGGLLKVPKAGQPGAGMEANARDEFDVDPVDDDTAYVPGGHAFLELEDDRDPAGGFYQPPDMMNNPDHSAQKFGRDSGMQNSVLNTGRRVGGGQFRDESSIQMEEIAPRFINDGNDDDDDDPLGIFGSSSGRDNNAPPLPRAQARAGQLYDDEFDDDTL